SGESAALARVERIRADPLDTFSDRFLAAARTGEHDFIFVSQVFFGSGRLFGRVADLALLTKPEVPCVIVDGYHAFMAIDRPLSADAGRTAFCLGGGYKYAMAGE